LFFVITKDLFLFSKKMSSAKFVTAKTSNVSRSFYVVANEPFLASGKGDHCLDLFAGDIFLITSYNKVGYWWGVSVYDLDRQGWIPSSLVQPYTGEVPSEASDLKTKLSENFVSKEDNEILKIPQACVEPSNSSSAEYNIIADDSHKFQEYESVAVISREGKKTFIGDSERPVDLVEKEDFDYEAWADSKREYASNSKRSRIK
jgi:hypothetical protein